MIGGDRQLYQEVLRTVDAWVPKKAYDHESKFQNDLQEFLDTQLNSGGGEVLGLGAGGGDRVVKRESGGVRADLSVDDQVGIEMKRDLSNSQTNSLRGQIENYLDEFPFVIVCACGIQDMSGWRELKNKYSRGDGGLGIESGGAVEFIHKDPDNYGNDPQPSDGQGGGLDPFSLDF